MSSVSLPSCLPSCLPSWLLLLFREIGLPALPSGLPSSLVPRLFRSRLPALFRHDQIASAMAFRARSKLLPVTTNTFFLLVLQRVPAIFDCLPGRLPASLPVVFCSSSGGAPSSIPSSTPSSRLPRRNLPTSEVLPGFLPSFLPRFLPVFCQVVFPASASCFCSALRRRFVLTPS